MIREEWSHNEKNRLNCGNQCNIYKGGVQETKHLCENAINLLQDTRLLFSFSHTSVFN